MDFMWFSYVRRRPFLMLLRFCHHSPVRVPLCVLLAGCFSSQVVYRFRVDLCGVAVLGV
jgi:hypothetical protein